MYILSLIDKLSLKDKNLILFKYYEGLKDEEIAFIMDIPIGTVKSGLYYAKKKLKSMYSNDNFYGILFISSISKSLNINYYKSLANVKVPPMDKSLYVSKSTMSNTNYLNGIQKINMISTFKIIAIPSIIITSSMLLAKIDIEPSIESISYDNKNYTNKNLELKLNLNSSSFLDELYILDDRGNQIFNSKLKNKKFLINIKENGIYKIYTKSIFNKVSNKNIIIDNIDKIKPKIIDYKYDNKKVVIYITDNLSNIDYKKTYITDIYGNKFDFAIKEEKNEIVLKLYNHDIKFILYLYDNANNLSKYLINVQLK